MKLTPWYQGRLWHGIDLFSWLRLLVRNRFAVSPSRIPLAFIVLLFGGVNTVLRSVQSLWYGPRIARTPITPDPVFIIGHWRTGTTVLHELLALDKNHRAPTTYESLSPNHFLISDWWLRNRIRFLLPKTRPMDNMPMGFDLPQEDEIALFLRGTPSPFATVAFPNRPPQDPGYRTVADLPPAELQQWKHSLLRFLRELLLKRPGQLVLKSPQHTFRLKVLSTMFPQARFIHIVRNPYVVFPSTVHFWETMYTIHGVQRPTFERLHEEVFTTFSDMHETLEKTRPLIDEDRFYELRYEDLVRDPLVAVRAIYEFFDWHDFENVAPAIRQYVEHSKDYQTNRYELTNSLRDEITRRWKPYIEKYGYQLAPDDSSVAAG